MSKTPTGIQGFDDLIGGGFPKGRTILISGTPGTGKTIYALQYIYNGATQFGDKGLYVTFEENAANLKRQARMFGWDFDTLEKEGKVRILAISAKSINDSTVRDILNLAKEGGFSRLVIDSLSALSINAPTTFSSATDLTELSVKRFMYHFINELQETQATSLLVSQTTDNNLSSDGVSEFICDGIIFLKYEPFGGEYSRHLTVRKMREVKNDTDIHPVEITEKGIVVHELE